MLKILLYHSIDNLGLPTDDALKFGILFSWTGRACTHIRRSIGVMLSVVRTFQAYDGYAIRMVGLSALGSAMRDARTGGRRTGDQRTLKGSSPLRSIIRNYLHPLVNAESLSHEISG